MSCKGTTSHFVYVLHNTINVRMYIGYTVNPHKRLRQHNGEIKGGAKSTANQLARGARWKILFALTSRALDRSAALSVEWHFKALVRRQPQLYSGSPAKRIDALPALLTLPQCQVVETIIENSDGWFRVFVDASYLERARELLRSTPGRTSVCDLDNLHEGS